MIAIVEYQLLSYSGNIRVTCNKDDADKVLIDKARKILEWLTGKTLPGNDKGWKVIKKY